MKKLVALVVLALSAVAVSAGPAGATQQTVTVAMKDPGCHWFLVAGKYQKSLTVHGPVSLFNIDEAALRVKSAGGVKLDRVGGRLALGRGTYHITMVGQAPDDNHLLLVVR